MRLRIEAGPDLRDTRVWIDGFEINGLTAVHFSHTPDTLPQFTLSFEATGERPGVTPPQSEGGNA